VIWHPVGMRSRREVPGLGYFPNKDSTFRKNLRREVQSRRLTAKWKVTIGLSGAFSMIRWSGIKASYIGVLPYLDNLLKAYGRLEEMAIRKGISFS